MDKPEARPSDLLTRRVVARARGAQFIAVPVAIFGDPAPGRSALEQREPKTAHAVFHNIKWLRRHARRTLV